MQLKGLRGLVFDDLKNLFRLWVLKRALKLENDCLKSHKLDTQVAQTLQRDIPIV